MSNSKRLTITAVALLAFSPLIWLVADYYISGRSEVSSIKRVISSVTLPEGVILVKEICSYGDIVDSPHGSCQFTYSYGPASQETVAAKMRKGLQDAGIKISVTDSNRSGTGLRFSNDDPEVNGGFNFNTLNQISIIMQAGN
jgi:hypothetical protein